MKSDGFPNLLPQTGVDLALGEEAYGCISAFDFKALRAVIVAGGAGVVKEAGDGKCLTLLRSERRMTADFVVRDQPDSDAVREDRRMQHFAYVLIRGRAEGAAERYVHDSAILDHCAAAARGVQRLGRLLAHYAHHSANI